MNLIKTAKSKPEPAVESRVIEYLEKQGYQITANAKLRGKSGIEHTFDALAKRDDGFTAYTTAICITLGGDKESEANSIFNFANKAYDVGIKDRVLFVIPSLHPETKRLAEKQRIKVIDEESLEKLETQTPRKQGKLVKTLNLETKPQLLKSLSDRCYRSTEQSKRIGK